MPKNSNNIDIQIYKNLRDGCAQLRAFPRLPTPDSRLPTPDSGLPTPDSRPKPQKPTPVRSNG
ncbi:MULTISPECIES: hypothetical protein [unclassified Moorena]|uniref:hypothetical protein n=1 Tax=unclassified Moorena TaxID=2683338 RepID=UPI0013BD959E|nr:MULTISPECIES: hypothetical protein [unclassified Moorena]NEP32821.1 hypothetical protein [Moorena sp. SIO3B2]NEP63990.1 hypothetical protein [Moorena sp. SIO3A5]NEQ11581.1 hypothetical protein [Moorena sp. SIO4E2]